MRTISITSRFKRDDKRESRGNYRFLDPELMDVVGLLTADQPLPERLRDHALSGEWNHHRDCHIKPDSVLI
jgi:mRNA interferase YafQ